MNNRGKHGKNAAPFRMASLTLLCVALMLFSTRLQAQLPSEILEVHPLPNQSVDTLTTSVDVVFAEDVPEVDGRNFLVYGNQTGLYPGTVTFDSLSNRASFRPDIPYKIGEEVTAVLTSEIIPGTPGGCQWTFNVSPYAGEGLPSRTMTLGGVNFPYAVASGDLNGDGYLDLVSADVNSDRLTVFYSDRCDKASWGGFLPPVYLSTGPNPTNVLVLDVDGNNTLDLIASHYLDRILSVHLNNGEGDFQPPRTIDLGEVNPSGMEAAEFTGDGFIDLLVTGVNSIIALENDGNGGFIVIGPPLLSESIPPGSAVSVTDDENPTDYLFPFSMATGDVDNDGYIDLLIGSFSETVIRKLSHKRDRQYFQEEAGDSISLPYSPLKIELAELECSTPSYLDLVIATEGYPEQYLRTYLNDGTGRFPVQNQEYQVDLPPDITFYVANLDPQSDAVPDLDVLVSHLLHHQLLSFTNNCGLFGSLGSRDTDVGPRDITGGDFNLDGAIDIAVPNSQSNNILLYLSDLPVERTLTVHPGVLDFGAVPACDADTLGIWILNENLFPAEISRVDVVEDAVFHLSSIPTLPVTLSPGDSMEVFVMYQPGAVVPSADYLRLQVDNCNIVVDDIPLTGMGSYPLVPQSDPLDFGKVKVCGGFDEKNLYVSNGSRNTVRVSGAYLLSSDSVFTVESIVPQLPVDLDPGEFLTLLVRYEPVVPGEDDAGIRFVIDNCSIDSQVTGLRGEGDSYTIGATPDAVRFSDTIVDTLGGPVRVTVGNLIDDAAVTVRAYLKGDTGVFFMNASCSGNDSDSVMVAEIPPAGSIDLCVFFRPPDQIPYGDTLIIEPEDDEACPGDVQRVPLSGLGILNDPPRWIVYPQPEELRYYERESIEQTLMADDPDGDDLSPFQEGVCVGPSLPTPITPIVCPPSGDYEACLTFDWTAPDVPDDLDSIVYHPRFIVQETGTPESYADTLCLDVVVLQRLPDLRIESLTSSQTNSIVNRSTRIECVISDINRSVREPFVFRMTSDSGEEYEWVLSGISEGAEVSYDTTFTLETIGSHWVEAFIDVYDSVREESEGNNRDTLWLNAERGDLILRHNPFTPNDDGYNDLVEFDIQELGLQNPRLFIFSMDGRKVAVLSGLEGHLMRWNGKDENGRKLRPGAYLFVLKDGNNGIASGTIGLVR